jgi:hypothetical protein
MTITRLIVSDILSLKEFRQLISRKNGRRTEWEAVYSLDSIIVIERNEVVLIKKLFK